MKAKKNILIVVDMQNDFTTGVLGNKECTDVIDKVKNVIEMGDYDNVIFTMDTHNKDYLNTKEGRKLPVEHCIRNTAGWEIVPELKEAAEKKYPYNVNYCRKETFGSKYLAQLLEVDYKEYKENLSLTFVGVCTGICVISNVALAKAFCPEADIKVIADACACVTSESHQTAIEAMRTFQVDIV